MCWQGRESGAQGVTCMWPASSLGKAAPIQMFPYAGT